MNLLADENVDKPIVDHLRYNGFSVIYIAEIDASIPDEKVLEKANLQEALLLTGDKDFGELVFRQRLVTLGVCLIRLSGLSLDMKSRLVTNALLCHGEEMYERFSVLTPAGLRIREKLE